MHHRHHSPRRHLCRGCHDHKAGWTWSGRFQARADHDLCPRCYKAALDRARAEDLARQLEAGERIAA